AGAALLIDQKELTGTVLAERITDLLEHPDRRREMAQAARRLARRDAARAIVDKALALTGTR
ncbi:MAG: UDP-N-acetylglucosamine--N-acetylmuramyl-(pentapeptide) pyrophosphoryl-undecaprenol N-acetylglucosamine transferase, partial [Acidobacteria bacterium]|nr:UDP-N-acetylglucosamine--N-acetylmuramyl-(pentapeptide) pyrophosphoryl-undecaprenol N-acetylglucosamine transferase [Acidobacteriota bacterium]